MKRVTFPIVEVVGNRLVSKDGVNSLFFEISPPDITQLNNSEIDNLYEDVGSMLNNFDEDCFYKFYSKDGRIFLNTNSENMNLFRFEATPWENPLEMFFEDMNIFSDVTILDDSLLFNGKYRRVLSVLDFGPDPVNYDALPNGYDYVLCIKKKNRDRAIKDLEKVRSSHMSNFLQTKRDIVSEGAYNQAEELLQSVTMGQDSLFDIELYFVVTASNTESLNKETRKLVNEMNSRKIKLFIEGQSLRKLKSGLGTIFTELVPGVCPSFSFRTHTDKTSHLKYLIPSNRSHLMGDGIEFVDEDGYRIYFDPFSRTLPNKNMLITGASGGGKSVLANKIIHELVEEHPTVILDKGGSFRKLTMYHDGVNLSSEFNPLQFKDPIYLRELVLSVCDKSAFNHLEKGRLLKSIKEILEVNPTILNFQEFLGLLEKDFENISLYFEDVKGLFSENVIENVPILYVDIDAYPKGAVAPLIIFLLEYFKHIETKEKILVFDESWSFLKDHADYIDDCFRTFRKTGALPIAISQGLKDFAGANDKLYSSITNNSFIKIFFPQEIIDDPEVTEFDMEKIRSLRFEKGWYSECYLKSSDNRFRKIIRIYLNQLEEQLFHTEFGENDKLFEFFNEYRHFMKSNKETIDAFVRLQP